MPPKRKQKRIPRRMNVRFKGKGDDEFAVGYTKNISAGGMFIGTIRPFPPGTEILIEVKEGEHVRRRPAVVCHAARVSPLLASVKTSGMGVRFLDAGETGDQVEVARQPLPLERPVAPEVELQEPVEESSDRRHLEIDLAAVERYREAFRRDIQHGLIFVLDPGGLEIDQEVVVTVLTPGAPGELTLKARVDRQTICRSEAYGEPGKGGFMLILVEAERAVSQLRAFL